MKNILFLSPELTSQPILPELTPELISAYSSLNFASGNVGADPSAGKFASDSSSSSTKVIPVRGILIDKTNFIYEALGWATSYQSIAKQIAERGEEVDNIILDIDSPGGEAVGLIRLSESFALARQQGVTFTAQVNTLCASAAYYIACCCDKIYSDKLNMVGSIGTICSMTDSSGYFTRLGIEAVVIATGDYKGTGYPGTKISESQRNYIRENMVTPYFNDFIDRVKTARGFSEDQVQAVADGKIYTSNQALELGLIDGIQTMDMTLETCTNRKERKKMTNQKKPELDPAQQVESVQNPSATTGAPVVAAEKTMATLEQLDAAFPKAESEFKLAQLRAKATLDSAKDAYISALTEQIEHLQSELNTSRSMVAQQVSTAPSAIGVNPIMKTNPASISSSARAEVEARIAKLVATGVSHQEAGAKVFNDDPQLREKYLEEINNN